jgi:4-amino-4-deoxy-L-arabinose transferase-like glycosyltransferase
VFYKQIVIKFIYCKPGKAGLSLGMKNYQINILIIIGASLLFFPFLGKVHLFDWDEINFAECAREMIVTHNYSKVQINFLPFWEKPPLFIWLQALSMRIFGVNEFAARFPNALIGIIYLLVIFHLGKKIHNRAFGLIWALAYAGSFLPFFYFKSGIIDPLFNLFIFLGINFAADYINAHPRRIQKAALSGFMIGLAMMTKGPVAMLIFLICAGIFILLKKFKIRPGIGSIFIFLIMACATGGIWFLIEWMNGRAYIVQEFITYQLRLFNTKDAGHGGPFYYHAIVLVIGCFPASIFALKSMFTKTQHAPVQKNYTLWMGILFWVVLILFSIVKTKILHYSSLCYLPFTYFAAITLYKLYEQKKRLSNWVKILLGVLGGLMAMVLIAPYFVARYKNQIIGAHLIKDSFAEANFLAEVVWQGWEPVVGILLLAGLVYSLYLFSKNIPVRAMVVLFTSSLLTTFMAMAIIAPKVEGYSQLAAIEFYQSKQAEDCYVETLHFKSYAQLFYTHKQPPYIPQSLDKEWLLNGPINKTAYFVCKNNRAQNVHETYPQLQELYRKNGFVFWVRKPL